MLIPQGGPMLHHSLLLPTLTALLILFAPLSAMDKKSAPYPPTRTDKAVDRLHGVEVPDPYRWLEDADSAEVRAWVEKQNAYTQSVLDKLPGREKIHQRLSALLDIGTLGT